MKQVFEKIVAGVSVMMVFCLHVYFVMLLGTKPALAAQTEEAKETVVKVGLVGTDKKEIIKKEVVIKDRTDDADSAQEASAASIADDESSSGDSDALSIKINGKDGIVIKGSDKLAQQLKDLERTIETKVNEREMIASTAGSFGKTLENVLVPIMIFLITFGFAGYVVYSKQRTRKETLDTIRTLAQNNQPIPPELLANLNTPASNFGLGKQDWNSDPNSIQGIKYMFIGLGIGGFLMALDYGSFGLALVVMFLCIGGFHIVKSNLLQKKMEAKKSEEAVTVNSTPAAPTTPSNT